MSALLAKSGKHCNQPEPSGALPTYPHHTMMNRINNAICFLFAAAAFAMIGLDAGNHTSATHSGTQQVVLK